MAITKIQSESLNLADDYAFTGTITGAGGANTPAFEAERPALQNISNSTVIKIEYYSEKFDTDNCYDTSNFRFTPTVAGKYFIYASVLTDTEADGNMHESELAIFKNGSRHTTSYYNFATGYGRTFHNKVYAIVDFNGSSDYVEMYVLINDTVSNPDVQGSGAYGYSKFGGYKIIE